MKTSVPSLEPSAQLVRTHYLEKRAKNPGYSVRAFARDLGVSHALLSLVMNGKRAVTPRLAAVLSVALKLSPGAREQLIQQSLPEKSAGKKKLRPRNSYHSVDLERFQSLSQWYSLAILELTLVRGFRADPAWVAKKLQISIIEARDAMERLQRLGFLVAEGSSLRKKDRLVVIQSNDSVRSIRHYHIGAMERAIRELKENPSGSFEKRWIGGGSITIPRSKVARARERMIAFQQSFIREFSSFDEAEEVYQVNLQFFPLT